MAPKALVARAKAATAKAKAGGALEKSRWANRRQIEDAVDRSLEEHFPGTTVQFRTQRLVAGVSLRDRLLQDKAEAQSSGKRLSSTYWRKVKEDYAAVMDDSFTIQDQNQPLQNDLLEALKQAMTSNTTTRSTSKLLTWAQKATECNQKEFCGLARFLLSLRPAGNQHALMLILEVMRMIIRLEMNGVLGVEMSKLHDCFDQALTISLTQTKRTCTEQQWWEVYKDISQLVLDCQSVDTIFAAQSCWSSVAKEVATTVKNSCLGYKLFGWAEPFVCAESVEKLFQDKLNGLDKDKVTHASMDLLMQQLVKEGEAFNAQHLLSTKRHINLKYRGISCEILVQSFVEEANFRISAYLKDLAVSSDLLPEMAFEERLWKSLSKTFEWKPMKNMRQGLDGRVLKAGKDARALLKEAVGSQTDGALLMEMINSKIQIYLNLDPTFRLEVAAWQEVHMSAGQKALEERVLECFPQKSKPKTFNDTLQELEDLSQGALYKFLAKQARSSLDTAREVVVLMAAGTPPNIAHMKGDWHQKLVCKLDLFCLEKDLPSESDQEKDKAKAVKVPRALYGAAAFRLKLELAVKEGDGLSMEHLTHLQAFSYLGNQQDRARLKELTELVLKKGTIRKRKQVPVMDSAKEKKSKKHEEGHVYNNLFY